jgi:hypothetical protein
MYKLAIVLFPSRFSQELEGKRQGGGSEERIATYQTKTQQA